MTEMYVYMIIHVSVACSKLLFRVANDCVQASSYANLRGPAGICDVQKVWTVVDENEAVSGISQSTFWTLKNRSLDGRAWISESPQQTFKHLLYVVVLALKVGANQNVTSPFFLDCFTFNSWTWRCMMARLEHAGNFLLNVHRKTFHLTCLGDGLPPRLFATSKLMALVVSIFRERRGVTIRSRLNKQVFQTSDLWKLRTCCPNLTYMAAEVLNLTRTCGCGVIMHHIQTNSTCELPWQGSVQNECQWGGQNFEFLNIEFPTQFYSYIYCLYLPVL